MADQVVKTINCRHASIQGAAPGTLQQLMSAACKALETGADRSMQVGPDPNGKTFRLIAQHYPYTPGFAGVLVQYEKGTNAVSLIENLTKTSIPLEHFAPPPTAEGARQWVEGVLYFYVRKNTIVFIQSASLRADQLEDYLSWLLTKNQSGAAASVVLNEVPPQNILAKIQAQHVKRVTVVGDIERHSALGPNGALQIDQTGTLISALKATVAGNNAVPLNWNDALDANIKAAVTFSFSRSTTQQGQALLDTLALALRNASDVETEVELLNGQVIKGNQLKLQVKKPFPADDGVLQMGPALQTMQAWLVDLVTTHTVTV